MTDIVERLRDEFFSPVCMEAADEIENLRAQLNASVDELTGRVMKNSGGSANPETVRKVILALRGERVSFVS
jgi:Asp-tRNA(Asn)/Glu-tRNA(Gln) amidotransferase B subunit